MSAKLESIAGPRKGEIVRLSDNPLSIGRDPSNQLAILDSALSRHHCQIEWRDEAFFLRDLENTPEGKAVKGTRQSLQRNHLHQQHNLWLMTTEQL